MSPPVLISATDISRHEDGRVLLDQVSLEVAAGDRVGVFGPTGSGKSLLLRTLAMLEPVRSGTLLWNASPVTNDHATRYRSRVMYVHQQAPKFEGSVESVLRMPLSMRIHRGRAFDRKWVVEQLAFVGRDASFLSVPHQQLSGGETQMIAILRAAQLNPQVLLLDEPTSALDEQSTHRIESIVRRWYESGEGRRAFVWVSHDERQLARTCTRLLGMRRGRIETTEELGT